MERSAHANIGADLKTDALGRSTHTIRKLWSRDCQAEIEHFEKLWTASDEELKRTYGDSNISKTTFFSSARVDAVEWVRSNIGVFLLAGIGMSGFISAVFITKT